MSASVSWDPLTSPQTTSSSPHRAPVQWPPSIQSNYQPPLQPPQHPTSAGSRGNSSTTQQQQQQQQQQQFIRHLVAPKDTLQGIALKYGVPVCCQCLKLVNCFKVGVIKKVNKMWSENDIYSFRTLDIPVSNSNQQSQQQSGTPSFTHSPLSDNTLSHVPIVYVVYFCAY